MQETLRKFCRAPQQTDKQMYRTEEKRLVPLKMCEARETSRWGQTVVVTSAYRPLPDDDNFKLASLLSRCNLRI